MELKRCTCGGKPTLHHKELIDDKGCGKDRYLAFWVECGKCGKRTGVRSELIHGDAIISMVVADWDRIAAAEEENKNDV